MKWALFRLSALDEPYIQGSELPFGESTDETVLRKFQEEEEIHENLDESANLKIRQSHHH